MTDSRIGLIHLSDIHLDHPRERNKVIGKSALISSAACSALSGVKSIYIVVTGDIAQSATNDQYKVAEEFLSAIKSEVEKELRSPVSFVLCPGNHDCDLSKPSSVRDLVINNARSENKFDDSVAETCLSAQDQYSAFATKLCGSDQISDSKNKLFSHKRHRNSDHDITFLTINTAWVSRIPEESGSLWFPIEISESISQFAEDPASIVVSLFHHPYVWIEADNGRKLRRAIEFVSDIIATGHEHDPGSSHRTSGELESNLYIEGGALQDWTNQDHSEFNVLCIDPSRAEYKAVTYAYSAKRKIYEPKTSDSWKSFQRNRNRLQNKFLLQDEFRKEIEDPGTGFKHPRKNKLLLPDLFVYPNMSVSSRRGKQKESVRDAIS